MHEQPLYHDRKYMNTHYIVTENTRTLYPIIHFIFTYRTKSPLTPKLRHTFFFHNPKAIEC